MVACRYFLQGACRFGDNCRYEHIIANYNTNVNVVRQQQAQLHRQQPLTQFSSNDFYDMVKLELELAERGNQWPLSCYCPFPSRSAALPGLDDYSPEELRCLMYQAQSSGNVETCRQQIENLYRSAQEKRNLFKSQTPDCKAILERVRSSPASPSNASGSSNPFIDGNSSGPSIFGGNAETANVQTPIFGGSVATIPQASVFGGGSGMQANPFGAATAPQPSVFGGGTATATASVNPFMGGVGGQPSPFGTPPAPAPVPQTQTSFFGGTHSGQPSIFGGQTVGTSGGSIFGGNSSAINAFSFAAVSQNQGFIHSAPAPQPFMAPPASQTPTGGSIFGGTAAPVNPFGTPTQPISVALPPTDSGAHTPLNDLSEEESAEFMAPTFSRGRIPLRPPPSQLCT